MLDTSFRRDYAVVIYKSHPREHDTHDRVGGCLSRITLCESQARGDALGLHALPISHNFGRGVPLVFEVVLVLTLKPVERCCRW